ncbi:glycoside hydrolase [Abortiporus biennis]|nr:glycoside hydrolase [Abortiporus biennis]
MLSSFTSLVVWGVLSFNAFKTVLCANSFAGSNLYYAAGLRSDEREALLSAMNSAGMKVLRVWLDGQSTTQKGTNIDPFPSLEPTTVCNGDTSCYNDTVLVRLDEFMVDAHAKGIKLLISMYSFNALSGRDVYAQKYTTQGFYESADAQQAFDARLRHVMNHVHTTLQRPWQNLSDYIFGFEAQNEAMIGLGQSYIQAHTQWQCDRAGVIKSTIVPQILTMTGGESWMDESVQPGFLSCAAIDVVSIHAYGVGDYATSAIQTYIQRAQSAGKKLIMEEWGACYFDTENNNCPNGNALSVDTRNNNIKTWAGQITTAGLSWLYWQVIPNTDPHDGSDFEVGITDPGWPVLKQAALDTLDSPAAFDFSDYLL